MQVVRLGSRVLGLDAELPLAYLAALHADDAAFVARVEVNRAVVALSQRSVRTWKSAWRAQPLLAPVAGAPVARTVQFG